MNLAECLNYFDIRFRGAMQYKEDTRQFILQDINDPFSEIDINETFGFWCKEHDENQILIYYDPGQIALEYLSSGNSDKDLQLIFNYLATHEYGHTFISDRERIYQ